jgi:cytochrome c-type biogenesis protein CcmH/NrfF
MWPDVALGEVGVWSYARALGSATGSIMIGVIIAATPARAHAQDASSLHAGTVELHSQAEREIFPMLLCQCGACARLPLDSCVCSTAEEERAHIRTMIDSGTPKDAIFDDYVARFGTASLAVPPNRGKLKSIWLVPLGVVSVAGLGAVFLVRKWRRTGETPALAQGDAPRRGEDEYDRKLDEELRRLDD